MADPFNAIDEFNVIDEFERVSKPGMTTWDALRALEARIRADERQQVSGQLDQLVEYIDGFLRSGNAVPVDRGWLSGDSWAIAKEMLAENLPINHNIIEAELVYRRKLAAYGEDTKATSPLQALRGVK